MNSNFPGSDSATGIGMLIALGAGIKWLLDYLLKFLGVRSSTREQDARTDLMVSEEVLDYSKDLRADLKTLRAEVSELRKDNKNLRTELEEFRTYMQDMYNQNVVLKRQNDEFRNHLKECAVNMKKAAEVVA